jgi:uncharacterized protein (TIGR03083 family)
MSARRMAEDERADLAAFLATLSPGQWQAPTLCEGSRVRDVVAHVMCYDELGAPGLLPAVIRGRFRPARVNAFAMADLRTHSPDQLLAFAEKAPRTSRAASGPRRQGGARRRHHSSPGHPARPWPAPCHTTGTPGADGRQGCESPGGGGPVPQRPPVLPGQ